MSTQPTKPVFTQTRDPKRTKFVKDPNRNYLLVETETAYDNFEPLHESYMNDKMTALGEDMYTDHGYQPGICPSRKFTLLSCSLEDYQAHLNSVDEETRRRMKSTDRGNDINDRETKPVRLLDVEGRMLNA